MSARKRPKRRRRVAKDSFERRALRNAWANLEVFEAQLSALDFATRDVRYNTHSTESDRDSVSAAWWTLRSMIYGKVMEAHRVIFMFSHLGTEEDKEEAVKLAYKSFLKKDYGVLHLLEYGFKHPGSWRVSEDKLARADIERAFNGRELVPRMKQALEEIKPLTAVHELSDGETLPPANDMLDVLLDTLVDRPHGLDSHDTGPTKIVAAIQALFRHASSGEDHDEPRTAFELIQKMEEELLPVLDAMEYIEFGEDEEKGWWA